MTEGPPELSELVRTALERAGFRVHADGTFVAARTRTRFRGTVSAATSFACQYGLPYLEQKLEREAWLLVRSSERNRFLERKAHAVYSKEMSNRMKRLGLKRVVVVEDEQ